MIAFPNCKINIGLNILGRRKDGYHDIETVFCPIQLSDILEFTPSAHSGSGINLKLTGHQLECEPGQNLCVKAYKLISKNLTLPFIDAHLHKIVPTGAGLGGGSSDAAFMLKMLTKYFDLPLTNDNLCEYASILGSDCPFFIMNRPLLGTGRGNIFREIRVLPENIEVFIVHPGIHVSTAEAYAGIKPAIPPVSLENLINLPIEEWKHRIKNDFEESIFKKHPVIGTIRQKLYDIGAVYASMSGSGSAVYGLFRETAPEIKEKFPGMFVWTGNILGGSSM
jgi:4-diphosphocytidyl-2-C-methyl-D-erythritol kinase